MDLRSRPDAVEHGWVDAKVICTIYFLRIGVAIDVACIMAGDPLEWLALPMGPKKRICNSFDDCAIPLYECVFTRI